MNPTESFSNDDASQEIAHHTQPNSDLTLMDIDDVLHQNDIELLKQQLAAAHQLLTYQQDVVHALTEQVTLKESCLSQAEQHTVELQQQCNAMEVELSEAQSVCSDLRELLKRQQRRSPTKTPRPTRQENARVFNVQAPKFHNHNTISFGYESSSFSTQPTKPLTKAPPVEAWSAAQENSQEEAVFCQRLTTLVVASTSRVSNLPSHPVIDVSAQIVSRNQAGSNHRPVELPRFAMG